jgi:hypothetical protein
MRAHFLSAAAYMLVTFGVQAANHFVINKAHYARQSIIAAEPALAGGIASMLIQGAILTFLYSRLQPQFSDLLGGLGFALLMGLFLGSYIALGEPSKYVVSSRLERLSLWSCQCAPKFLWMKPWASPARANWTRLAGASTANQASRPVASATAGMTSRHT